MSTHKYAFTIKHMQLYMFIIITFISYKSFKYIKNTRRIKNYCFKQSYSLVYSHLDDF